MRITDWSSYLMSLSQVISIGGLLIFGFTTSWVFGREYSDKTMIDLLVIPIKKRYDCIIQVYSYRFMELFYINYCTYIRIVSRKIDWTFRLELNNRFQRHIYFCLLYNPHYLTIYSGWLFCLLRSWIFIAIGIYHFYSSFFTAWCSS